MDAAILARVEDFCIREGLLQPGAPQHLAAAVSGGADSMALLLLLRQLQPRFGYTLSACHVNHGLRGQSADRDEAFVRAECARLGVPLRVFHATELASPPVYTLFQKYLHTSPQDYLSSCRMTACARAFMIYTILSIETVAFFPGTGMPKFLPKPSARSRA